MTNIEPTFDADGYPTDDTLDTIKGWNFGDNAALMRYIRSAWSDVGRVWESGREIHMATGGWSGNESIIQAMMENHVFWAMCWASSTRGGKYVFEI